MNVEDFLCDRRTAHVKRWHHRPTIWSESVAEHHALTARVAYFVAEVLHERGLARDFDVKRIVVGALFHDEPEVLTGDVPRATKDANPDYAEAVAHLTDTSVKQLLWNVDQPFKGAYAAALSGLTETEQEVIHYADQVAALAFVLEEVASGNTLLDGVRGRIRQHLSELDWEWLRRFREAFPTLP